MHVWSLWHEILIQYPSSSKLNLATIQPPGDCLRLEILWTCKCYILNYWRMRISVYQCVSSCLSLWMSVCLSVDICQYVCLCLSVCHYVCTRIYVVILAFRASSLMTSCVLKTSIGYGITSAALRMKKMLLLTTDCQGWILLAIFHYFLFFIICTKWYCACI